MHDNHDTHELAEAQGPEIVELADGDEFDLEIAAVAKRIGDATVRMLAYNGSIPGPTLRLPQGATVTVHATNHADVETTVHWHGLRLDNRFDGTHHTQPPIPVGGTFTYRVHVPDPGAYWYHPHIREDYGQELGLYGNVLVTPSEPDYWPPANRELLLTLDDILIEDGRVAAFGAETTHVAMGRFGNVMLVGGDPTLSLEAGRGEVVRLYLTNTANTRVFNVMLPGARMKLVGADSGHYEREEFVDAVLLAPSERAVVDVLFPTEGEFELEHRTPERSYRLASITVEDEPPEHSFADTFPLLRTNRDMAGLRERIEPFFAAPPDKTVSFVAELDLGHGGHAHHHHHHGHHAHAHGAAGGIEWEDEMAEMNRVTTTANTTWKLVDRETGAANAEIDWTFKVGDQVKLRLINEPDSDHPMPHPFHIHGAGRFVVLARDGVVETNLVWKDTVLVRTGETLDILLDVTNPGRWMAHCHIAEHHESGMMFSFDVTA